VTNNPLVLSLRYNWKFTGN